jgi:hypothetical protein
MVAARRRRRHVNALTPTDRTPAAELWR